MFQDNENAIDEIIKESLMEDFQIVSEDETDTDTELPKYVLYPKIGGIVNIGRSGFVSSIEIKAKDKEVQNELAQKYGSEMYGIDQSYYGQRSTGTKSGTGTSSENNSKLISCKVQPFLVVPQKPVSESSGLKGYALFQDAWNDLIQYLSHSGNRYNDFIEDYTKTIQKLQTFYDGIIEGRGPNDKENRKKWNDISDYFTSIGSNGGGFSDIISSDKQIKRFWERLRTGWNSWDNNADNSESPENYGKNDDSWNPNLTFKITVHTNFNEDWYKRKYKSGLLNKALYSFYNAAIQRSGVKSGNDDKLSPDQMTDADKRKLDSYQWKITNQVAKDYISMLLGWVHEPKTYIADQNGAISISNDSKLVQDKGFGQKMANKALNNRGILGRLKQKILAGGQSNNMIQVVFQLADPSDGWTMAEEWPEESETVMEESISVINMTELENVEPFNESDFSDDGVSEDVSMMIRSVCRGESSIDGLIDSSIRRNC